MIIRVSLDDIWCRCKKTTITQEDCASDGPPKYEVHKEPQNSSAPAAPVGAHVNFLVAVRDRIASDATSALQACHLARNVQASILDRTRGLFFAIAHGVKAFHVCIDF